MSEEGEATPLHRNEGDAARAQLQAAPPRIEVTNLPLRQGLAASVPGYLANTLSLKTCGNTQLSVEWPEGDQPAGAWSLRYCDARDLAPLLDAQSGDVPLARSAAGGPLTGTLPKKTFPRVCTALKARAGVAAVLALVRTDGDEGIGSVVACSARFEPRENATEEKSGGTFVDTVPSAAPFAPSLLCRPSDPNTPVLLGANDLLPGADGKANAKVHTAIERGLGAKGVAHNGLLRAPLLGESYKWRINQKELRRCCSMRDCEKKAEIGELCQSHGRPPLRCYAETHECRCLAAGGVLAVHNLGERHDARMSASHGTYQERVLSQTVGAEEGSRGKRKPTDAQREQRHGQTATARAEAALGTGGDAAERREEVHKGTRQDQDIGAVVGECDGRVLCSGVALTPNLRLLPLSVRGVQCKSLGATRASRPVAAPRGESSPWFKGAARSHEEKLADDGAGLERTGLPTFGALACDVYRQYERQVGEPEGSTLAKQDAALAFERGPLERLHGVGRLDERARPVAPTDGFWSVPEAEYARRQASCGFLAHTVDRSAAMPSLMSELASMPAKGNRQDAVISAPDALLAVAALVHEHERGKEGAALCLLDRLSKSIDETICKLEKQQEPMAAPLYWAGGQLAQQWAAHARIAKSATLKSFHVMRGVLNHMRPLLGGTDDDVDLVLSVLTRVRWMPVGADRAITSALLAAEQRTIAERYAVAADGYCCSVWLEQGHQIALDDAEYEEKPPPSPPHLPKRQGCVAQTALPDAVEASVRFGHHPDDDADLKRIRKKENERSSKQEIEIYRYVAEAGLGRQATDEDILEHRAARTSSSEHPLGKPLPRCDCGANTDGPCCDVCRPLLASCLEPPLNGTYSMTQERVDAFQQACRERPALVANGQTLADAEEHDLPPGMGEWAPWARPNTRACDAVHDQEKDAELLSVREAARPYLPWVEPWDEQLWPQRDKGSVEKARARLRVRVACGLADAALQERG